MSQAVKRVIIGPDMTEPHMTVPAVAPMVHHCCMLLSPRLTGIGQLQGLVVGCGNGDEVVFIERTLNCRRVLGIDVEEKFSHGAREGGQLVQGDAETLPFPSNTFHFAVALHSLEHVHNSKRALDEVSRVLRPGGWFYMGVPNRSRVIGYLGSYDFNTWQKIRGNLLAWRAQLTGRFRNELGAHAGFDRRELAALLGERFANVELVTKGYIRFKYGGRIPRLLLEALLAPLVFDYTAASHYALCQKPA